MDAVALYIHIPFCASKCAYCDFVSYPGQESRFDAYFEALRNELERRSGLVEGRGIGTIYIGGGTPSLVPPGLISGLMAYIDKHFQVVPGAEITIEANPGTVGETKLMEYRNSGINRISIGAQAFNSKLLGYLGRIHSPEDIYRAVENARESGFENISLDLMYGLPGQDIGMWEETIRSATELAPEHISAYSLIVEDGTAMALRVAKGVARLPEDEQVNHMQRMCSELLRKAGYERYEISNYSKKGFECRHNMTYWLRGDYLGIGIAAHSLIKDRRFYNGTSLEDYIANAGDLEAGSEEIDASGAAEEEIMLATRTAAGLDADAFKKRYGRDMMKDRAKELKRLCEMGLIEIKSDRISLTERGMELHNAIILELI